MENRVVVTGMGALTPAGLTVQDYWQALLKGQDGIGPVTYFDASDFTSRIVGELKGFEPSAHFTPKEARRFDPFVKYALAAAAEIHRWACQRYVQTTGIVTSGAVVPGGGGTVGEVRDLTPGPLRGPAVHAGLHVVRKPHGIG